MNYSNKTIGTEQEFPYYSITIENSQWNSPNPFDITQETKCVAIIKKGDVPLVRVTGDSFLNYNSYRSVERRLELSTFPAAIDDTSGWDDRKEAIRLFAERFMPKQAMQTSETVRKNAISLSQDKSFVLVPQQENFSFYFTCKATFTQGQFHRCNNQFTLGYTLEMLDNAIKRNHSDSSCDVSQKTLFWYKEHCEEIKNHELSPIECFAYSLIASIFEFSVRVHATYDSKDKFLGILRTPTTNEEQKPINKYEDQNHTDNKNKWGILPRSSIQHIIDDLNFRNQGNGDKVLNLVYIREPNCDEFAFGEKQYSKETMNDVYKKLIEDFRNNDKNIYASNSLIKAGLLDTSDTINNKPMHLMEFRRSFERFEDEAGNEYPKKNFLYFES